MTDMAVKAGASTCRGYGKRQYFARFIMMLALFDHSHQHGFIYKPESRATYCSKNVNKNCGPVMYEPQSVEGGKGFPTRGPPDGHIAGGGVFPGLDETGPYRWERITLNRYTFPLNKTHLLLSIKWYYTAPHRTSGFWLYGTINGYDGSEPLTRSNLRFLDYVPSPAKIAYENYNHTIAKNRLHRVGTLLSIWDVDDTSRAFYQAIDYRYHRDNLYCYD